MLASEMIELLQELIRDHGNLPVYMDDDSTPSVEFNNDTPDDLCFVVS